MPTLSKQLQVARDHDPKPPGSTVGSLASRRSSSSKVGANRTSLARVEARREFLRITTKGNQDEVYTNPESLPSVEMAYNNFQRIYPKFSETWAIDDLRDREYFHLEESQHVCMDYCGFGLFSYYQQVVNKAASSFGLAYISANLPTHALYGAADEGTTEFYIRKRVMDYLNISDTEYSMVFTASRGSAFKLLGESYPFHLNPKLLTVYDFESEAVTWMAECAKQKGAKIMSACFKWPSLRISASHLKKLLQEKKKKSETAKGLFVFPVQSRMTGAKYSYQWMSQAQQNKWHVLLDASALGPKDMDSLGLSLFRPDFIVSSFYKVFGTDPTGFGCLFIKNTAIHTLHNSSRARGVGMVRIVSLNSYAMEGPDMAESEDEDGEEVQRRGWRLGKDNVPTSSFSGPYFTAMEADSKTEDVPKTSKYRVWKSWKRHGKTASHNTEHSDPLASHNTEHSGPLTSRNTEHSGPLTSHNTEHSGPLTSHNKEHSGPLTGSSVAPMDTVLETEGGPSEYEYGAQLTKSGYYLDRRAMDFDEESPIRWSEDANNWDRTRRLNGGSVNDEIREIEDDGVSGVGNGGRFIDSQWGLRGRVNEIEEEDSPIEFQSFAGHGISPIQEEDAEGQDTEELEESGAFFASDTAIRSGDAQTAPSNGRLDGRVSETEEDAVDMGRNFEKVASEAETEEVEAVEMRKWDSSDEEQGASLDRRKTESEEIAERNLFVREQQRNRVNEVSEVDEVVEPRNSLPSDAANDKHKGLVGSVDIGPGKPPRIPGSPSRGLISPSNSPDVTQATAENSQGENSGESVVGFAANNCDHSTGDELAANSNGVRKTVTKDNSGYAISEPARCNPSAGGNLAKNVGKEVSETEGIPSPRDHRELSIVETKTKAMSECAGREVFAPADEILHTEIAAEPALGEDVSLDSQQGHAVTTQRETESANELIEGPGSPQHWSRTEEFAQEHLITGSPFPSSEGAKSLPPLTSSEPQVVRPVDTSNLCEGSKSPANVSLGRNPSLSIPQTDSRVRGSPLRSYESDSPVKKDVLLQRDEEAVRSTGADSVAPTSPLREGTVMDKLGRPAELNGKHLITAEHDGHSIQYSSTSRAEGGTPYESGEENYITILPSRVGKNAVCSIPETVNETRSSGSQELSDKETSSSVEKESGRREYFPAKDDFLSPELSPERELDHSGEEERSFESPRRSLSAESDSLLPSVSAPVHPTAALNSKYHRRGQSVEEIRFDNTDFHDARDQSSGYGRSDLRSNRPLSRDVDFEDEMFSGRSSVASEMLTSRNDLRSNRPLSRDVDFEDGMFSGRSSVASEMLTSRNDLRSNRPLSRDVDFEDEMFSGRSSVASEMLTSRRRSTTLADDIVQSDLQDSDEDSFFQSQYYSGSLQGSSASRYLADELPSARYPQVDEGDTDDESEDIPDAELWGEEGEPLISCKGLDFADSLGLTKLNYRLRYLVNWLVNSLLKLQHPGPNEGISLVRIYGPKVSYDRGAAISFNLFDWKGLLIQPGLVQRLADRSNISLGVGRLCNIVDPEMLPDFVAEKERLLGVDRSEQDLAHSGPFSGKLDGGKFAGAGNPLKIPVLTVAMGFVTSFEDVYKLWSFLANFLDADFVSKEVWRYHSLNQQTIFL